MIDRATRHVGTEIPTAAELLCRYVLGLRYPDVAYLEALETYLDARYVPGVGYKVTSFLEWLDPLGAPLEDPPRPRAQVEVDWILTATGAAVAAQLLAPSMGSLRIRRPSRAVLVALAAAGAVEGASTAGQIAVALAAAGVERQGTRRWRTGAQPSGATAIADLWATAERVQSALEASPWLSARLAWPSGTAVLRNSLAQLAHGGLVRRVERRVEAVVTAGVVRRRHVEALRTMVRRGDAQLSPLARGLLARRLDRTTRIASGIDRGTRSDARALRALAAAHLRSAGGQGVDCLAEQVVLRHPLRSFSPSRRDGRTSATEADRWATRRVDLALWAAPTEANMPALLVELERPDTSTHFFDRVRSHIEGAMAISSSCADRIDVCFVAHSEIRPRVVATVAGFREQFRLGATGAWSDANVGVRVVPLGRARREGLGQQPGDFATHFYGHRSGRRPTARTSPVAFLARSA